MSTAQHPRIMNGNPILGCVVWIGRNAVFLSGVVIGARKLLVFSLLAMLANVLSWVVCLKTNKNENWI
jgi:hypothetical protein